MKQARGVPVVRGDGWRTFGRLLHVSELFTRISGTCVRRGALPVAIGQRGGVRRKKKMVSGWNEFVGGNWAMVRQICPFADGHTASNAPDLF